MNAAKAPKKRRDPLARERSFIDHLARLANDPAYLDASIARSRVGEYLVVYRLDEAYALAQLQPRPVFATISGFWNVSIDTSREEFFAACKAIRSRKVTQAEEEES